MVSNLRQDHQIRPKPVSKPCSVQESSQGRGSLEGRCVGRQAMPGAAPHRQEPNLAGPCGAHERTGDESGPASSRSRLVLASALLVLAVVAVAALAQQQQAAATELFVPPRLAALRARLQSVEDNMMGASGSAALRAAKQAQSLQLVINNEEAVELRTAAASTPGPATLQTLTSFKARAPAIRYQHKPAARTGPEITYASAVTAGAARGPDPLDTSGNKAVQARTAAEKLAANLARYRRGTRRMHGPQTPTVQGKKPAVHIEAAAHVKPNANPWSVVPRHPIVKHPVHKAALPRRKVWGPRAVGGSKGKVTLKQGKLLLEEGDSILSRRVRHAPPKGFVEVRPLRPGQKLPKGAKLLPQADAAKLAAGAKGATRTQVLTRVMLDDEEGGESNSTETGPPREEIGDTGMTVDELKAFAESEKAKAKYLLGQAETERNAAMTELDSSREMIAKGWGKHNEADQTWAEAEKHMANSTMLFSTYQRELATAKAEKEGSLAEEMAEIAEKFKEDAEEKHAKYEEALGESPDLDLVPYGMDAGNATDTTAPAPDAEEEAAV